MKKKKKIFCCCATAEEKEKYFFYSLYSRDFFTRFQSILFLSKSRINAFQSILIFYCQFIYDTELNILTKGFQVVFT